LPCGLSICWALGTTAGSLLFGVPAAFALVEKLPWHRGDQGFPAFSADLSCAG